MFQDRAQAAAPDLYAYKTADETVTSSDTLQNDDHLTVTVKSGRKYHFLVKLFVTTDLAADFKVGFGGTTTASYFVLDGLAFSSGHGQYNFARQTALNQESFLASGGNGQVTLWGSIEPSSDGTLVVKWSQGTSDPASTTVLRGSVLSVWRLA